MSRPSLPLEFAHIAAIRRIFREPSDARVGIGDDAAVIEAHDEAHVYTVDAAVEGVHFERAWLGAFDIGWRAFMAAASDIAAMGARASHALCAWTLPRDLDGATLRELAEGTEAASLACAAPVVGGNLARSPTLTLTTTIIGRLSGPPLTRHGGAVGQRLYVTGALGGPRVGLARLRRDAHADDAFTLAFRRPRARFDLVDELRAVASCAIDLSDGLLPDLAHLCGASGLGARVELARLPCIDGHEASCARLGLDANAALLAGGEEYEILFAAAPELALSWARPIGELLPLEAGIQVRAADGSPYPPPAGFEHFA